VALFKREDSKYWWYKFKFGGKEYRASTKCSNRREAQQIEAAKRTQLAKGEVGIEAKRAVPNFDAAMKDFLAWQRNEHAAKPATAKRLTTSSKALLKFFKDKPLDEIEAEDIERYKQWRIKQKRLPPVKLLENNPKATTDTPIKPATVNRELACLKSLFNRFIKDDVLLKNPVGKVKFLKEESEQMRVVSDEEERLYLMACSQPLRDVAILMLETGMRPEEVFRIERRNVHLDKNYIFNPFGKTKAAKRKIPLSRKAHEVLRFRLKNIDGEFLFPSGRGGKDVSKSIVKLTNGHKGAVSRSGVAEFRLYDLRHTFATRAAESGVDLVTLKDLLGHSRLDMVLRYAHPSEKHRFDAIRKIEEMQAERLDRKKAEIKSIW
jgi:integrase